MKYNKKSEMPDNLDEKFFKLSTRNVSISAMVLYMLFGIAFFGSGIYFTLQRGTIDLMGIGLGLVFVMVAILMFFGYRKIELEAWGRT